jgi:hypothetical protein
MSRGRAFPSPRWRLMRQTPKERVKRVMVRYTVKPERAAENVEFVRAVYDELHSAQAAEGFDMRCSRSRTASASFTSSRPRMNTTPSPTSRPSGASRGHPRTLRGRPGRERAARNRLLPARRRLRQGSAPRPAARRDAKLLQAGEAGTGYDLVGKRCALQVVCELALGHGGSPICTTAHVGSRRTCWPLALPELQQRCANRCPRRRVLRTRVVRRARKAATRRGVHGAAGRRGGADSVRAASRRGEWSRATPSCRTS